VDLALLVVAVKALLPKDRIPATARELRIGESCPQDNTYLPVGAICVNNRVQPKL